MMDEKELRLKEFPNWFEHFEWRYLSDNYPPCRVLDYGCGYGFSDFYLAFAGFSVFGYDPDRNRIEVAEYIREHQIQEVQNRTQFANQGWVNIQYDLIWASHVFEHVPYDQWGDIFNRLSKFGSSMLISVPLGYAYDMPEHIHHWNTPEELQSDLEAYSGSKWSMSVDESYRVIRAKGEL